MYWNYRIVRTRCACDKENCHVWSIYEVYYESDGTPTLRTEDSVAPMLSAYECEGEEPEHIIQWMEKVLKDLKRAPVLNDEDIQRDRSSLDEEAEAKGTVEIPFKDDSLRG